MTHVNTLPEYLSSLCEYIKNLFPNKYCSISDTNKVHHKRKYELIDILVDILFVTENGIAWRKLKDRTTKGISWITLYNHFNFLSKNNVFQKYYKEQTTNYYKLSKAYKLKYQYSDTSFIKNINCLQEYVGRNPYFKNKNCAKLSLITDKDGYPISICMNKGNEADINCLYNNLDNMIIDTETQKYNTKQNKYKQVFLADKGYDSTNLRGTLTNLGYVPIIPFNKRNTKNIKKIKKLSPKEKVIYRKRIKVENIFSNIKKNKKVDQLYEKSLVSYMSFLYISLIKVTSRFNNILNTQIIDVFTF